MPAAAAELLVELAWRVVTLHQPDLPGQVPGMGLREHLALGASESHFLARKVAGEIRVPPDAVLKPCFPVRIEPSQRFAVVSESFRMR